MRRNNKGFSLVELIVALAIFAIAGVAVFGFMVNSSRLYQRTNVEVKLQYEQQLAVNQIRDMYHDKQIIMPGSLRCGHRTYIDRMQQYQ